MLPGEQTQTVSQASPKQEVNIQFNSTLKEAKGKTLAEYANQILKVFGKPQDDGSVQTEGRDYILSQKDNDLSVTAKDGRGEVLNNNGFTDIATDNDVAVLQKMAEVIEHLRVNNIISQGGQKVRL